MEDISKYNLDNLIKVKITRKKHKEHYEWLKEKKILFGLITTRKEGLYNTSWTEQWVNPNFLPIHYTFQNNKVYQLPMAVYYFQGDFRVEKIFGSFEEAKLSVEKILAGKNINLIEF